MASNARLERMSAAAGTAMLGGMGAMPGLPLPPNFEKLLQQGGLASLPLPPGMTNGSLSSSLPPNKRHLPPDAQVWHTTKILWALLVLQLVLCIPQLVLKGQVLATRSGQFFSSAVPCLASSRGICTSLTVSPSLVYYLHNSGIS